VKTTPAVIVVAVGFSAALSAHNGPPFPVITDKLAGNYTISLWADPDASDAGDADGQFWVMVKPAAKDSALPPDTMVQISIWPMAQPSAIRTSVAQPDAREPGRRSAAFVIAHEGKFGVKATIAGSLGPAEVDAVVDAEYGTRPQRYLIPVFALPFVLIGFVWIKLLLRRRVHRAA
jgi:hypothetical protein